MTLTPAPVRFDRDNHTYTATADGHPLRGVTPIVKWMFPDTYHGIPQSILDRAAQRGTAIHAECQYLATMQIQPAPTNSPEARAYFHLLDTNRLTTLETEYLIADPTLQIASSIDAVLQDPDHRLILCDIKTTNKLHRPNVQLQLSIYARLLELQCPGLHVHQIIAAWLPNQAYRQEAALITLPRLSPDDTQAILDAYLAGADPQPLRDRLFPGLPDTDAQPLPDTIADAELAVIEIENQLDRLKQQRDQLTAGLLRLMERHHVKRWQGQQLTLTYVPAARRQSIDAKALRADHPDIAQAYTRETPARPSLRITIPRPDTAKPKPTAASPAPRRAPKGRHSIAQGEAKRSPGDSEAPSH